jgi:predicted hydrocarbon binding protein
VAQPAFRDRLEWSADGSIDAGDIRYLIIRPDSLMGLFSRLDEGGARQAALEAFGRSVAEHGRKSMVAEMQRRNLDGDGFYRHLSTAGPSQLGWGHWHYTRPAPNRIEVAVDNSPFVYGIGSAAHPVCAPIAGMLTAIGGLVFGGRAEVHEESCAAMGNAGCRFIMQRAA